MTRAWLAAVLALGGCLDVGLEFRCERNEQCVAQGRKGGRCEATHYCSFTDGTCPSGSAYGNDAPRSLANHCIGDDMGPPTGDDLSVGGDGGDASTYPDAMMDASVGDLALRDQAVGPLPDFAPPDLAGVDGSCGTPQLLVTTEYLPQNQPGSILRFQLPPYPGLPQQCVSLTGSGQLDPLLEAVVPYAPHQLAVAGRSGIYLLDTEQDQVLWVGNYDTTQLVPMDIAPLQHNSETLIAVAMREPLVRPGMNWLYLYSLSKPDPVLTVLASTLGLSDVPSMTLDPADPTKLLVVDNRSTNPVVDERLDPYATPAAVDDTTFSLAGGTLAIAAVRLVGGGGATVVLGPLGLYLGVGGWGPFGCACGEIQHVAPDYYGYKDIFHLCGTSTATSMRQVYRGQYDSSQGTVGCRVMADGMALGDHYRMTHLGYVSSW
jgi:hypothetical protein